MQSQVSSKGICAHFVLRAGDDSSALKWASSFLTNTWSLAIPWVNGYFSQNSKKTKRNRSKADGLLVFRWQNHGVSSTPSNPPGSPLTRHARRGRTVACSSFLTCWGLNPPAWSGPQPPKIPLYSHGERLFSLALQNDGPLKVGRRKQSIKR